MGETSSSKRNESGEQREHLPQGLAHLTYGRAAVRGAGLWTAGKMAGVWTVPYRARTASSLATCLRMVPSCVLAGALLLLVVGCKESDEHWRPFGDKEAVQIHLSQQARYLLNQFPLVQILDETLDFTTDIVIFKVKGEDGEEFELFYRYWDGKWIKRVQKPDGSYSFEEYLG